MSSVDQLAKDLYKTISESDNRTVKPYDTKAEVLRVEGDTVWVKIPGGIDETPVQKTNNATPGDTVMVRVAGGRAWIAGNNTSPATDDTRANQAYDIGTNAGAIADIAIKEAGKASEAANLAELEAGRAQNAAEEADTHADQAEKSANNAQQSADIAFKQLGFVEDIVGVLSLIAEHGQYAPAQEDVIVQNRWYFNKVGNSYEVVNNPTSVFHLTADTVIDVEKTYYERTGSGTEEDPYVYTAVETPVQADLPTYYEKYYVLVGIEDAIQNYVSSHLVLVGDTLSLRTDGSPYMLNLTTGGMQIVGPVGSSQIYKPLATYGTDTIIGDQDKFHVRIDGEELGFYDGKVKVAYVRNNQLFIERSVVVEQMDIGYPYGEINPSTGIEGKGQWSWKVHDVNGRNNLYLKWLG